PLGILDAWMWAREKKDESGKRGGPKESLRWIEGYERIAEMAPCGATIWMRDARQTR
ncbi:IS4 family transposase, partial [Paraburkholderia sp. NMBU_R16]|nr:IS4 family transposase [Paraburkholderia sp. NMBU_R16]